MDEKYTNSLSLSVNYYDFVTAFYKETTYGQETFKDSVIALRMSPQMAKAYAKMLKENVEEYERKFGEIAIPEENTAVANE